MDQAAANVEAPTEQPHDEKDCKDSPKHRVTLLATGEWPLRIKSGALKGKLSGKLLDLRAALGNRFEAILDVQGHLVD